MNNMHPSALTITSEGQVTIPKAIRNKLNLDIGDKVEFRCNGNNEIVLKPVTKKVQEVLGMLSQYKQVQPVSVEDMNAGIEKFLAKKLK